MHPGLIPVDATEDDARLVCQDLQQWADRAVELGVHRHDVLAVRQGVQRDGRPELHGARDVADHVDRLRGAECSSVLRDSGDAVGHRTIQRG